MELKMFDDFLKKYDGQIIRYWQYKKPGLPYKSFGDSDEGSPLVSEPADYGRIVDAYVLPDGDIMLGLQEISNYIEYYKLSEILIAWSDLVQEDEDE